MPLSPHRGQPSLLTCPPIGTWAGSGVKVSHLPGGSMGSRSRGLGAKKPLSAELLNMCSEVASNART